VHLQLKIRSDNPHIVAESIGDTGGAKRIQPFIFDAIENSQSIEHMQDYHRSGSPPTVLYLGRNSEASVCGTHGKHPLGPRLSEQTPSGGVTQSDAEPASPGDQERIS